MQLSLFAPEAPINAFLLCWRIPRRSGAPAAGEWLAKSAGPIVGCDVGPVGSYDARGSGGAYYSAEIGLKRAEISRKTQFLETSAPFFADQPSGDYLAILWSKVLAIR